MREELAVSKPKLYVLLMRQDDPRKCTAGKLARLRLAIPLYRVAQIPQRCILLTPFSSTPVLPADREQIEAYGLVAVDCSWEKVNAAFAIRLPGLGRRLPTLLAGNPTNYAKQHKLSSVEAMAAALYITGHKEQARQLLSPFKWGETFLTLNQQPLESYSRVKNREEMSAAEAQYF